MHYALYKNLLIRLYYYSRFCHRKRTGDSIPKGEGIFEKSISSTMSENKVKVYFLGSGDISIPIMEALRKAPGLELTGVASQKKESKGAGPVRTIKSPLVKHCEKCGIPIERYPSVNKEEFHNVLRERGVELLVVASYGQILKPELLALPKYGCLNVHASLLPKYRGASPIVASLLNGDRVTGVSFMQMEAGLDTGPIYRMCELEILPDDNADTLEERLGKLAGESIEEVILEIVRQGLKPVPQCHKPGRFCFQLLLCQLCCLSQGYNTGGVHGGVIGYGGITFRFSDGSKIDNFLKDNVVKDMQPLLKKGLKEYFSENADEKVTTDKQLMENLMLSDENNNLIPLPAWTPYPDEKGKGLIFTYQQYEIACYAAGMPSFILTWEELKPFLRDDILEDLKK